MKQLRLAILSNAGGSGKTTLATHLTYLISESGSSVALIDLDPQGSVSLFGGLPRALPEHTMASVLGKKTFLGEWPLVPLWKENVKNAFACQGELGLVETITTLSQHKRGAYLLSDRLEDYPLEQDVIIFDCPATLGPLPVIALSACTHILIPIQLEPKSIDGSAKLLEWLYQTFVELRLQPKPEILGFVPNQYDRRVAIHRTMLDELNPMLDNIGIQCFPPIRYSTEFKNASSQGIPLHLFRPTNPACKDFTPIMKALQKLINQLKEEKEWALR
jgi:chromosome partitioning protein